MASSALTNIGLTRKENQDAFLCYAEKNLYAVADGMGGYNGGAIASEIAISILKEHFFKIPPGDFEKEISGFYELINKEINAVGTEDINLQNMGTTLLTLMTFPEEIRLANVGDSKAFLYRKRILTPLTVDQNLAGELVRQGKITEREAFNHKGKYMLTSALGNGKNYNIDFYNFPWKNGDIVLLCSDGLCGFVPQRDIRDILLKHKNLDKAAQALVQSALDCGGKDNITVILVKNCF